MQPRRGRRRQSIGIECVVLGWRFGDLTEIAKLPLCRSALLNQGRGLCSAVSTGRFQGGRSREFREPQTDSGNPQKNPVQSREVQKEYLGNSREPQGPPGRPLEYLVGPWNSSEFLGNSWGSLIFLWFPWSSQGLFGHPCFSWSSPVFHGVPWHYLRKLP